MTDPQVNQQELLDSIIDHLQRVRKCGNFYISDWRADGQAFPGVVSETLHLSMSINFPQKTDDTE